MSSIRFKNKYGDCFILYVTNASWGEGDYNTSETAIVVPPTLINSGRCVGTIDIPTPEGFLTLDFNLNGRTGSCNQCGQCCAHLITQCPAPGKCCHIVDGIYHHCKHLQIKGPGIGKKNGTACAIFNSLLYEGYKQCLAWPAEKWEIANCPACGFRFP